MLHAVRILPLLQHLASKISFDMNLEIKEVFFIVSGVLLFSKSCIFYDYAGCTYLPEIKDDFK